MEELIHFKLFLHIRGKQEEVRRFSCESNVDIGKLNAYIKEKFVHLGDKEFVLKWEDEDGDKVDINSQQELRLAMQEMKKIGPVYKLQIHILENPWWKQVSVPFQLAANQNKGHESKTGRRIHERERPKKFVILRQSVKLDCLGICCIP